VFNAGSAHSNTRRSEREPALAVHSLGGAEGRLNLFGPVFGVSPGLSPRLPEDVFKRPHDFARQLQLNVVKRAVGVPVGVHSPAVAKSVLSRIPTVVAHIGTTGERDRPVHHYGLDVMGAAGLWMIQEAKMDVIMDAKGEAHILKPLPLDGVDHGVVPGGDENLQLLVCLAERIQELEKFEWFF